MLNPFTTSLEEFVFCSIGIKKLVVVNCPLIPGGPAQVNSAKAIFRVVALVQTFDIDPLSNVRRLQSATKGRGLKSVMANLC